MKNLNLQEIIETVRTSPTKKLALKRAYEILTQKYQGGRISTGLNFLDLFENNLKQIWGRRGFLHCTSFNKLLREILIKSGKFSKSDIKTRWTLIWYISPHQYLKVNVGGDKQITVDPWGKKYGIAFGDHAHGFHNKT